VCGKAPENHSQGRAILPPIPQLLSFGEEEEEDGLIFTTWTKLRFTIKLAPTTAFSSEQLSGGEVDKSRVTATFCCIADGSHKLDIFFTAKALRPHTPVEIFSTNRDPGLRGEEAWQGMDEWDDLHVSTEEHVSGRLGSSRDAPLRLAPSPPSSSY
jgi:hypothetical protein